MSRGLVVVGGLAILLSAVPHALLGWPPMAEALRARSVDAETVAGLAVGWYFGSAAMVAMGTAVLIAAAGLASAPWAWRVPFTIGLVYGGFGAAALVFRSLSPHFLVFVGIGALLVVGAAGARTTR